jgi:hypothetical protein
VRRFVHTLFGFTASIAGSDFIQASLDSVTVGPNLLLAFPPDGGTGSVVSIVPQVVIEKDSTTLGVFCSNGAWWKWKHN